MSDSATPWTVAYQAPPSTEFSRQEYWSGLPFPSPGDLHDPVIEPGSPALQADTLPSVMRLIHLETILASCPWKHYLPHNRSLLPKNTGDHYEDCLRAPYFLV